MSSTVPSDFFCYGGVPVLKACDSVAQAYTQSLTEVQTKMDRHQRELLQRLNFQDEVGSC